MSIYGIFEKSKILNLQDFLLLYGNQSKRDHFFPAEKNLMFTDEFTAALLFWDLPRRTQTTTVNFFLRNDDGKN